MSSRPSVTAEGQSLVDDLVDAYNEPADGEDPTATTKRARCIRERKFAAAPGRVAAAKQIVEMLEKGRALGARGLRHRRRREGVRREDPIVLVPAKDMQQ